MSAINIAISIFFLALSITLLAIYAGYPHRLKLRFVSATGEPTSNQSAISHLQSTKPVCSFDVFRRHLIKTGADHLTGSGTWSRRGQALARFDPSLCRLSYGVWIPRGRLVECFRRQNISYVVVLGDSNAVRFYDVVRRTLTIGGQGRVRFHCELQPPFAEPERGCRISYNRSLEHLTPGYFRCRWKDYGDETSEVIVVQYLTLIGDLKPFSSVLNSTLTGCWERTESGQKFVPSNASTVQV